MAQDCGDSSLRAALRGGEWSAPQKIQKVELPVAPLLKGPGLVLFRCIGVSHEAQSVPHSTLRPMISGLLYLQDRAFAYRTYYMERSQGYQ